MTSQSGRPWEPAALAIGLVLFIGFASRIVLVDAPLGYDEAVYALGGRELVTGENADAFRSYRPVGMQLLAAPGVLLGGSGPWLRVTSVFVGAICLFAFWLAARRITGATASWSLLAVLGAVELQRRGAELLSDVPSLAFALLLVWLLVRELERSPGPGRSLIMAAPLAAGAFYLRYGSVLLLVAVGLAVALVWWRALLVGWRRVVTTAALFAALLAPHLAHSTTATGTPLGILQAARHVAGRGEVGDGLRDYLAAFPDQPGGPLIAVLMIAGLASGLVHLVRLRRHPDARHRAIAFAFLAAAGHTVAVGLDVHGESRYIFFGMLLLTALGMDATVRLGALAARAAPPPWATRAGAGLAAALALTLAIGALTANRQAIRDARLRARAGECLLQTARWLAEHGGQRCAVVAAQAPQLGWYSGCDGYGITSNPRRVIARVRAAGYPAGFVVTFDGGRREPQGPALAKLVGELEQPPHTIQAGSKARSVAHVYRLRPAETRPDVAR